jgi:hypothetical protein
MSSKAPSLEREPVPLKKTPEVDPEESKFREKELVRLVNIARVKKAYQERHTLKNKLEMRSRRAMVGMVTRGFLEE